MYKLFFSILTVVSFFISSCSSSRKAVPGRDNGKIDITFVQVNDVYEIAPLDRGRSGGMARVATLKKEYQRSNRNTFLVMAGDFLSPSVYNSLKYSGNRIRGRQMVEAMNTAGMDIAIFGNHEFDITESELQQRINESRFKWVSSNTFHKTGGQVSPFVKTISSGNEPFAETYIQTVTDADGTTAKIGYIGLTIPFNKADYVSYTDPLTTAEKLYQRIKDSCDAVVAITHQSVEDDSVLAQRLPGLAVILGGHEHDMRFKKIGSVYITKAHANARSAYIVNLSINKSKHSIKVKPKLKMLDENVALDSITNVVVQKWMNIANDNYASLGFDATKVIMKSGEPLEARETEIRSRSTNFSRLVVAAVHDAVPAADAVIINSGSIRLDDVLQMPVTEYDIIRSLPFGGAILEVDMKGSLLIKTLEAGRKNVGIGGFLQYSPEINYDNSSGNWSLKNSPIEAGKTYKVALNDFLLTGGEANMDFLTKDNPDIVKAYPAETDVTKPTSDIRLAIVKYLEKNN